MPCVSSYPSAETSCKLIRALVVSIPIRLLWKVQIKLRQKIGLGAFLSLSVCMAMVSIIRIGGERFHGNYDFSWLFFWLSVESCIAVLVISLTAFPAIFVANASRRTGSRDPSGKPWYSSSVGRQRDRKKISSTDDFTDHHTLTQELPTYPSTAATGTRRGSAWGGRTLSQSRDDPEEEEMPLGQNAQPEGAQDVSLEKGALRNHPPTLTGPGQV